MPGSVSSPLRWPCLAGGRWASCCGGARTTTKREAGRRAVTVERLADWLANTNPGFFILVAALFVPFARNNAVRAILMVGGPAVALVALISAEGLGSNLSSVNVL